MIRANILVLLLEEEEEEEEEMVVLLHEPRSRVYFPLNCADPCVLCHNHLTVVELTVVFMFLWKIRYESQTSGPV
jgi:hypothetical protein